MAIRATTRVACLAVCLATVTELDLRGTPCPLNFIRTKLAFEAVLPGQVLRVVLDPGEPVQMVSEGMVEAGARVALEPWAPGDAAVVLVISRCA